MCNLEKTIHGLEFCIDSIEKADCPEECPYYTECMAYERSVIFQPLLRDSLELLKAKIPRVMTLEEVAELEEHQFVWIEQKNSNKHLYFLEIVQLCGIVSINMEILFNTPSSIRFVYTKDYNKNYRFWSSRPTDEQRSEVKWDE